MKISNKTGSLTPVDLFITVLVDLLNSRPYFFTLSLLVFNLTLVTYTFHFVTQFLKSLIQPLFQKIALEFLIRSFSLSFLYKCGPLCF